MPDHITPQIPYDVGDGASGSHQWSDGADEPGPLPSPYDLRRARRALEADPEAIGYLTRRGVPEALRGLYELGLTEDGEIGFPVRLDGRLVNYVRHPIRGRYYAREGRGTASIYPGPPQPTTILTAGMFDCLVGLAHNLPVVTTTTGVTLPDYLVHHFEDRLVWVIFDVGEERLPKTKGHVAATLAKLERVAARVYRVDLPLPNDGDDLADWFVKYRRSRKRLLEIITEAGR